MENICEAGWGETRSIGGAKSGAGASLLWPALTAPMLGDDLGVVPGTGAASFQNNKFLPELFQTDHNQARPAGNAADTACDIVTSLNFIPGIIGSLPGPPVPHHLWCQYIRRQQRHTMTLKTWPTWCQN